MHICHLQSSPPGFPKSQWGSLQEGLQVAGVSLSRTHPPAVPPHLRHASPFMHHWTEMFLILQEIINAKSDALPFLPLKKKTMGQRELSDIQHCMTVLSMTLDQILRHFYHLPSLPLSVASKGGHIKLRNSLKEWPSFFTTPPPTYIFHGLNFLSLPETQTYICMHGRGGTCAHTQATLLRRGKPWKEGSSPATTQTWSEPIRKACWDQIEPEKEGSLVGPLRFLAGDTTI